MVASLRAVVAGLPPVDRRLLHLRFIEERTQAEHRLPARHQPDAGVAPAQRPPRRSTPSSRGCGRLGSDRPRHRLSGRRSPRAAAGSWTVADGPGWPPCGHAHRRTARRPGAPAPARARRRPTALPATAAPTRRRTAGRPTRRPRDVVLLRPAARQPVRRRAPRTGAAHEGPAGPRGSTDSSSSSRGGWARSSYAWRTRWDQKWPASGGTRPTKTPGRSTTRPPQEATVRVSSRFSNSTSPS